MKKINLIISAVILFFATTINVGAASLSLSTSSYTVYVGSTVKITAKASSLAGKFNIKTSNGSVLSGGGTSWLDNSSETYTFTAKNVGTATITASPVDASDYDGNVFSSSKSVTITVKQYVAASSVNTLNSLSVDGYQISPSFNADTTEYDVTVPAGTESVNINATPKDGGASITGTGSKSVTEGLNNFDITVTAANGARKTYTVRVTVEEKEPIKVLIADSEYTVVRKEQDLKEVSSNYTKTTAKVNDEEVPAYYSEITNYTLIGMKDEEGNNNLYIYNEEKHSYIKYNEIHFNQLIFYNQDIDKSIIPSGYTKTEIQISDQTIEAYKQEDNDEYYLIYGTNIETGEANLYQYDSKEGTLQRYNQDIAGIKEEEVDKIIKIGVISIICIISLSLALVIAMDLKTKKTLKSIKK